MKKNEIKIDVIDIYSKIISFELCVVLFEVSILKSDNSDSSFFGS